MSSDQIPFRCDENDDLGRDLWELYLSGRVRAIVCGGVVRYQDPSYPIPRGCRLATIKEVRKDLGLGARSADVPPGV